MRDLEATSLSSAKPEFLALSWAAGVASRSCAKLQDSSAVSILSGPPPPQPPPSRAVPRGSRLDLGLRPLLWDCMKPTGGMQSPSFLPAHCLYDQSEGVAK
ncbi:hypothetical protein BT67DRAFT_314017 [Trichocladium antarcticum]|uniref:Uncharacterized protein n=1 Tax=Trichocladium antarcticum TaxID=1450529 RepID=A0AAN6ZDG3_9PEZI|nr:hypothetical protein BT67DRAFT_314017 [Trichocladium antarcticum]